MQVHVTHAKAGGIRLVFFPGERTSHGAVLGAIYVIGGKGERFEAAGGPRTGFKRATDGGHTGEPTPAGRYTLGPKQHVVTSSWPMSTIPFGAALRLNKGEVEWENDAQPGIWHVATGPSGAVTRAFTAFMQRSGQSVSLKDAVEAVRDIFVDRPTGTLLFTVWKQNDFGRWGWNLRNARGAGTAYFIHTTPDDEAETEARKAFFLANSHGCIHIRPIDRDKMIALGYLKQGVEFDVRSYDEKGPP
jgi:L,D-transpeptidase catalytic domain